jgi:hypothetical protein
MHCQGNPNRAVAGARRVAEKLLKSKTGERTTAPPGTYSLFMSSWINLQVPA